MIDISVKDLVKSFDEDGNLLDGISFDVQSGERVGLLGKNGAGKTTLFKILTGEIDYNSGTIAFAQGKKVGLISQIPVYPPEYLVSDVLRAAFSGLDRIKARMRELEAQMTEHTPKEILSEYDALTNRFEAGGGYEIDTETDKICNGLAIPQSQREQLFSSLSGGEKTRVNLARLLLEKTDILLLDEPTNHLDMHAVEWLEEYISRFKGTVLTISHDRYFLDRVVNRIIEISNGKAEFYSGNYSFYVQEKQARFELQLKQYEKEQAKLSQLGFTLERMKGWGINNRTLYRRAMSIQHRMDRIEKTEKPKTEKTMRARFAERDFFGDEVLSVKGLGKAFDGRTLFHDVDLQVAGGERIALLIVVKKPDIVKGNKDENLKLDGKVFVITGKLTTYGKRDDLVKKIESLGGKVTGSVSNKTHYLINNDTTSNSSKNKKAKELSIPILSEEDFNKLIEK